MILANTWSYYGCPVKVLEDGTYWELQEPYRGVPQPPRRLPAGDPLYGDDALPYLKGDKYYRRKHDPVPHKGFVPWIQPDLKLFYLSLPGKLYTRIGEVGPSVQADWAKGGSIRSSAPEWWILEVGPVTRTKEQTYSYNRRQTSPEAPSSPEELALAEKMRGPAPQRPSFEELTTEEVVAIGHAALEWAAGKSIWTPGIHGQRKIELPAHAPSWAYELANPTPPTDPIVQDTGGHICPASELRAHNRVVLEEVLPGREVRDLVTRHLDSDLYHFGDTTHEERSAVYYASRRFKGYPRPRSDGGQGYEVVYPF